MIGNMCWSSFLPRSPMDSRVLLILSRPSNKKANILGEVKILGSSQLLTFRELTQLFPRFFFSLWTGDASRKGAAALPSPTTQAWLSSFITHAFSNSIASIGFQHLLFFLLKHFLVQILLFLFCNHNILVKYNYVNCCSTYLSTSAM